LRLKPAKLFQPEDPSLASGMAWARVWLTQNLQLKLLSLFLALTIWGFVAPQRRGETSEIKFFSPLVLKNIPPNVAITSDPAQSINVLVRIPRAMANNINPSRFQVNLDLSNQMVGAFDYPLTGKNVVYNNQPLPEGLEVLQITPNLIPLTLEEMVEKELPIKPQLAGDVKSGYEILFVKITPSSAKLMGPRSVLQKLNRVYTKPLDVQDLSSTVGMNVSLNLVDHVRPADPNENYFQAEIKVGLLTSRLQIQDIPVIFEHAEYIYQSSAQNVNVFVVGPIDEVKKITNKNVYAIVDMRKYPPGDHRGLSPKVMLPEGVRVLEQWPIVDLFVLPRKIKDIPPPKNKGHASKNPSRNGK